MPFNLTPLAVVLAFVASPSLHAGDAERGYRLLTETAYLPPDFDQETFNQVWRQWPEPRRSQAEHATAEERRAMAFSRYGLTLRPRGNRDQPLQYVVGADGGWTMNCFACHAGQVADQVVEGLPNSHFALETLTEEIRATKLALEKPLARMDVGSLLMPLGTTRGTTNAVTAGGTASLFPLLFITIACGACSGFHSLIASGTTSKQLRRETDARLVGYGAMLLEAMVAVVSLCCVMMFAEGSPQLTGKKPNEIYAAGIGKFLEVIHLPPRVGMTFALMAFTTFVYDTLDVCTRLGRFILQELTGWHRRGGRLFGTALTAGVPLFFLLRHPADSRVEVWRVFWDLFGASNQLLAALTLLGITVWLWRTRRAAWVWLVTGLPTVFMYVMSTWALATMTVPKFHAADGSWTAPSDPVPWIGLVLLVLAALMLIEAVLVLAAIGKPPQAGARPAMAS